MAKAHKKCNCNADLTCYDKFPLTDAEKNKTKHRESMTKFHACIKGKKVDIKGCFGSPGDGRPGNCSKKEPEGFKLSSIFKGFCSKFSYLYVHLFYLDTRLKNILMEFFPSFQVRVVPKQLVIFTSPAGSLGVPLPRPMRNAEPI